MNKRPFNMTLAEVRAEIKSLLLSTKREGIENLVAFLEEKTHFFDAPASENANGAFEGGLAKHSLSTYCVLVSLIGAWYDSMAEDLRPNEKQLDSLLVSAVIVALLHDVCDSERFACDGKGNVYARQFHTEYGQPILMPLGHGEESVRIVQRFIKLSRPEAFAIRFHVGKYPGWEESSNSYRAYERYSLAILLHMADEMSKFCFEKKDEYLCANLARSDSEFGFSTKIDPVTVATMESEDIHKRIVYLLESTKREGIDKLISYMENGSDFFSAPSSTKYHGAYEGGLAKHSLSVYEALKRLIVVWTENIPMELRPSKEQMNQMMENSIIVALLHDMCKTNFYRVDYRNVRVYKANGKKEDNVGRYDWESVPGYFVRDGFSGNCGKDGDEALGYGHGEQSEYIVSSFLKLMPAESLAIRYHMGIFDGERQKEANYVYSVVPLAILLHMADEMDTFCFDKRTDASKT